MTTTVLDTRGLACPIPVIKAKKALASIKVGDLLEVHSTDPGSVGDFKAFAHATGALLVEQTTMPDGVHRHLLKKTR
jgi:tRNA 2-thiouridine synthesizing protein A